MPGAFAAELLGGLPRCRWCGLLGPRLTHSVAQWCNSLFLTLFAGWQDSLLFFHFYTVFLLYILKPCFSFLEYEVELKTRGLLLLFMYQ